MAQNKEKDRKSKERKEPLILISLKDWLLFIHHPQKMKQTTNYAQRNKIRLAFVNFASAVRRNTKEHHAQLWGSCWFSDTIPHHQYNQKEFQSSFCRTCTSMLLLSNNCSHANYFFTAREFVWTRCLCIFDLLSCGTDRLPGCERPKRPAETAPAQGGNGTAQQAP